MWLAVAALASSASAHVAVLEPLKDNTLFSTETTSNGSGDAVFCGMTGGGVKQRAVLAFDVAGNVAPGSTISSVTLTLVFIQQGPQGSPQEFVLHRLLADWGEGASVGSGGTGAPAERGDATWLHTFFPDLFWGAAGGDFNAVASASTTVAGTPGPITWGSTPEMVADVQNWLDDPGSAHGWLLRSGEVTLNSSKKFASRESPDAEQHPRLVVEFTPPPCPGDCGRKDGTVDIVDFLALLGEWGKAGGECDLGLGAPGVGMEEFNALLGNWGECP
jgi:hypothetical protein